MIEIKSIIENQSVIGRGRTFKQNYAAEIGTKVIIVTSNFKALYLNACRALLTYMNIQHWRVCFKAITSTSFQYDQDLELSIPGYLIVKQALLPNLPTNNVPNNSAE